LLNQCRLFNAVKSKDVDRLNEMQTCQRAKLLTTSQTDINHKIYKQNEFNCKTETNLQ